MRIEEVGYEHPDAQRLVAELQQEYVLRYGGPDGDLVESAQFQAPNGAFLVGYRDGRAVASGAWRTVDADELRKMNAEGKITGCVVDGPLSMDIAIDPEAAHHKGAQDRPAAGHADILLFPDIQAGNLVYKTLVHTADCKNGCILTGTKVPAILTSRSDSFQTKVNSIALAAVVAAGLDQ